MSTFIGIFFLAVLIQLGIPIAIALFSCRKKPARLGQNKSALKNYSYGNSSQQDHDNYINQMQQQQFDEFNRQVQQQQFNEQNRLFMEQIQRDTEQHLRDVEIAQYMHNQAVENSFNSFDNFDSFSYDCSFNDSFNHF